MEWPEHPASRMLASANINGPWCAWFAALISAWAWPGSFSALGVEVKNASLLLAVGLKL